MRDDKEIVHTPNLQIDKLPPYLPELNLVEHLWQWLRRHACRNRMFLTLDEVMKTLTANLNTLSINQRKQLFHCNNILHYK